LRGYNVRLHLNLTSRSIVIRLYKNYENSPQVKVLKVIARNADRCNSHGLSVCRPSVQRNEDTIVRFSASGSTINHSSISRGISIIIIIIIINESLTKTSGPLKHMAY